jgi:hypothetical protein
VLVREDGERLVQVRRPLLTALELQWSESENGRRCLSMSVRACCWGAANADEFQRTMEIIMCVQRCVICLLASASVVAFTE